MIQEIWSDRQIVVTISGSFKFLSDRQIVVTISGSFKFLSTFYRYTGFFHQAPGSVSANIVAVLQKMVGEF